MASRWGHPNALELRQEARAGFLAQRIKKDLAAGLTADQRTRLAALLLDADGGAQA